MRSVEQWERKVRCSLSKHESHQSTAFNSNNITLFKIRQCDAGLRDRADATLVKVSGPFVETLCVF